MDFCPVEVIGGFAHTAALNRIRSGNRVQTPMSHVGTTILKHMILFILSKNHKEVAYVDQTETLQLTLLSWFTHF